MEQATGTQPSPKPAGFFREALRELGRKRDRSKLRKQGQAHEQERVAALERLGQRAWEAQIDLSAFTDLRNELTSTQQRAGELAARNDQLTKAKAAIESRIATETAKYDAQRKSIDDQKKPVEAAFKTWQQSQNQQEKTLEQSANRQKNVTTEMATVEQQLAANAAPDQAAKAQVRKDQLLAERARLKSDMEQAQGALPATRVEVQRLAAQNQQLQAEIDRIEAERKTTLSPLQTALQNVTAQLKDVQNQTTTVAATQKEQFTKLGTALFNSRCSEQAVAQEMAQITALQNSSLATQQAIEASLAESTTVPKGTFLKFWTVVLVLPLMLVVFGVGGYFGWDWWHERQLAKQFQVVPAPINPYLSHSLSRHPAYDLADRLAQAKNEGEVQQLMLEAFRALNLGVYTYDGRQIQPGAEASDKDFFLYDFQWKTLARAYKTHNVQDYSNHSILLGKMLLEMDDPKKLEPELTKAIQQRYQQAQQSPNDPKSYLIFLVDGLARRQLKPYSLQEIGHRPGKDLQIDPLQSFLIMLDFFIEQPNTTTTTRKWWDFQLIPSVYAQSPCEGIVGNKGEKYWGWGVKAGGLGLPTLGKGTQIAGAAGDLLMLYALTLKITPTNYNFHLHHEDDYQYGFTAKVTFNPDGVPQDAIKCGWLAGKTMPQSGQALKDVELTWNIEPDWPPYLVVPHSMVQRLTGHLGFQTKTDADGESDFTVDPKDCPHKDGSKVVGRDLMMTATARVLTNKMPTPGTLGWISMLTKLGPGELEYLMNGRTGYCRFRVEWHDKSPKRKQRGGISS